MDDWSRLASTSPLAQDDLLQQSPFGDTEVISQSPLGQTDWTGYFYDMQPEGSWWSQIESPFLYYPGFGEGFDYDPGGASGMYGPSSSMTNRMIDADIDAWLRREHPELYDFTVGVPRGGVAGVGTVAQDPGFGQFHRWPEVYGEIQAAASRYGVPANFLQAILAAESSGDWDANNRFWYGRPASGPLLPYIGVFEDAALSRGFGELWAAAPGNRAVQIELLAAILRSQYDQLRQQNPQWGWLNVASYHYSGRPVPDGWEDEGGNGTNNEYMAKIENWWKDLDAKAGNTWSNYTDVNQNTGIGSPQTPEWGNYAQWDEALVALNANSGVPANLLKAFLRWGDEHGRAWSSNFDSAFAPNVDSLKTAYASTGDWYQALAIVMGVSPTDPAIADVKSYWDQLNADTSGMFGGAPGTTTPGLQWQAVFGNNPAFQISQEFGKTEYSSGAGSWQYDYSVGLGLGPGAHPGLDVGMPVGTQLFAPVSGTVIRSGGTGYFYHTEGSKFAEGMGELRIRLDNGHEIIIGHMANISVKVGDRVTPGMLVGTSGYTSAPHLHLEYRIPDSSTSSGWRAVDPRQALGGQFTGFHQGARQGLGYTTPLTFKNLMIAGASGQPIPEGGVYSQGGGNSAWTSWLRNTMLGLNTNELRAGSINYGAIYGGGGGVFTNAPGMGGETPSAHRDNPDWNPDYQGNYTEAQLEDIITAAANKYGVPVQDMLRVANCESGWNPRAVNSSSGASGLFQFMPSTWATTPFANNDIFDPVANANAAAWMWSVGRRNEWVCQ